MSLEPFLLKTKFTFTVSSGGYKLFYKNVLIKQRGNTMYVDSTLNPKQKQEAYFKNSRSIKELLDSLIYNNLMGSEHLNTAPKELLGKIKEIDNK